MYFIMREFKKSFLVVKDDLHIFLYELSVHTSSLFSYIVAELFLLFLEALCIEDIENLCL